MSEAAAGREVVVITVEVGKFSGVLADALRFCFEAVAKGTAAEGARLDLRETEGWVRCKKCGAEFVAPAMFTPCACGSREVQWLRGLELNIKSMELAVETEAA